MSSHYKRLFVFVPDQEIVLFGGCSQYGCLVLQIQWSLLLHGNQFMLYSVEDKKGGNVSLRGRIVPQVESLFDMSQNLCLDQNVFVSTKINSNLGCKSFVSAVWQPEELNKHCQCLQCAIVSRAPAHSWRLEPTLLLHSISLKRVSTAASRKIEYRFKDLLADWEKLIFWRRTNLLNVEDWTNGFSRLCAGTMLHVFAHQWYILPNCELGRGTVWYYHWLTWSSPFKGFN